MHRIALPAVVATACALAACGGRTPLGDAVGSDATDAATDATDAMLGDERDAAPLDTGAPDSSGIDAVADSGGADACTAPLRFEPPATYAAGDQPGAVTTGDFDGDGTLDLAVANASGGVSVLPGKGDGTFKAALSSDAAIGPGAVAIIRGDFDRDGKLDVVVLLNGSDLASVLLGKGDGTFLPAVGYAVGSFPPSIPTSIATQDLNGDGNLDLAVTLDDSCGMTGIGTQTGAVVVLLGKGDGTFQPASSVSAGAAPASIAVADFNGDGRPDLAVVDVDGCNASPGVISVLLGNGDGTFSSPVAYGGGIAPSLLVTGDFDGNGHIDLAISSGAPGLTVLLGKGDGTFTAGPSSPPAFAPSTSITAADFDGDGKLDLAMTTDQGWDDADVLLLGPPAVSCGPGSVQMADVTVLLSASCQ